MKLECDVCGALLGSDWPYESGVIACGDCIDNDRVKHCGDHLELVAEEWALTSERFPVRL